MSEYKIQDSTLTSIANAVRAVGYTQASLSPAQMVTTLGNVYAFKISPSKPYFSTDEYNAFVYSSSTLDCSKTGESIMTCLYSDFTVILHWTNNTAGTSGTLQLGWDDFSSFYSNTDLSAIGSAGDSVTMYVTVSASDHPGLGSATSSSRTDTIPEEPEPPED